MAESVAENQNDGSPVVGEMKLDVAIHPDAGRASPTRRAEDMVRFAERTPDAFCRVTKPDRAELASSEKLLHRNTNWWCAWHVVNV